MRVLAVVLAALGVGWWGTRQIAWETPPGQDIATVVRGSIGVNETLLTPPQAYRNVPITAGEMTRLSHVAQKRLAGYFTGAELRDWRRVAARTPTPKSLHGGKASAWVVNWHVDWIHLGELNLLPGRVTATASAEFRSNMGVINRADYTFHLQDTSEGWRIGSEEDQYESGYGP